MPRRRPAQPLCIILAATFTVSPKAFGQSQPTVIKADVRQVLVPVVVTDKKGHHVLGLKADDFEVSEDGTPQKIVAFSTSSDTAPIPAPSLNAKPKIPGTIEQACSTSDWCRASDP